MTRTLFLIWQDPLKRRWYPIGRLTWDGRIFEFAYTGGAFEAREAALFAPLAAFPDFRRVYQSDVIFPLFANRLMPSSRPDYPLFLRWLNVPRSSANPMVVLERSGGHRVTDALEVFPCPEDLHDGVFQTVFFLRGLRHMSSEAAARAENLAANEELLVTPDFLNPEDPNALALRTKDCGHMVGYCPRFLAGEIRNLMANGNNPPAVTVERVNAHPAPLQFRVLCRLRMAWPPGFQPFNGSEFQPIVNTGKTELQVA